MKFYRVLVATIIAAIFLVACSGDGSSESDKAQKNIPRAVTSKEAQLLSTALSNNAKDQNASFDITSGVLGSSGFVASGKVDWVNSNVQVEVSLFVKNQVDLKSVSTKDNVFESFLGLSNLASESNLEGKDWIARGFDPTKYGIDVLSQFIAKLAALTPDNPILLKQSGAQFLGVENIGGVQVSKFQNTPNVPYYLTKEGEMKKVSAKVKGFPSAVDVVFSDRTSTVIEVPNIDQAYSLNQVSAFYPEKRPAF